MSRPLLRSYPKRCEQQDPFNPPPGTPKRGHNPHPSLGTPMVFQVNMMGMTPTRGGHGFMEAPMHSSSMMDLPQNRFQEVNEEYSEEENGQEYYPVPVRTNPHAHRSNAFGGHSHRAPQQDFGGMGAEPKNSMGIKLLPAPQAQCPVGVRNAARPSPLPQTSRDTRDQSAQPTRVQPAGSFPQSPQSLEMTSPSLGKQMPGHTSHSKKQAMSGSGQPRAQAMRKQVGPSVRQTPQSFDAKHSNQQANFHRQSPTERPMTEGCRQNAAPNHPLSQMDDSQDVGSDDEVGRTHHAALTKQENEAPSNSWDVCDDSEDAEFDHFQGGPPTNYTNNPAGFEGNTGVYNTGGAGSNDNMFNNGAFPQDAAEYDSNRVPARHPQNHTMSGTHSSEHPPQRQRASQPPVRTQTRPRSHTPSRLQGPTQEPSHVNNDQNSMPPAFKNPSVTPPHNDTGYPTVDPSADETTSVTSHSTANKPATAPSTKRKAEDQPREETFAELLAETGGGLPVTPSTTASGQNANDKKALFLSPTLQDPMSPIRNLSLGALWSKAQEETRDKEHPGTQVWKPTMDSVITDELSAMNDFIKQTIASYNKLKTTCIEVLESKQRLTERRNNHREKVRARSTDVAHPAKRIRQH